MMKLTSKTINYTVGTIAELEAMRGYDDNAVVIVTDENRGGIFVYKRDDVATNNGNNIFNGWTREDVVIASASKLWKILIDDSGIITASEIV
jgi:hypothetical protein